jgi:serine protease
MRAFALLLVAGALLLPFYLPHTAPEPVAGESEALTVPASGYLVVDYLDNTPEADLKALEHALGLQLDWSSEVSEDEALRSGYVADLPGTLEKLRGNPMVEVAEPVVQMEALGYPDDPLYSKQWNMPMIGSDSGWRAGGGKGVIVAVIDTGVSIVPDLPQDRVLKGRSFVPGVSSSADDNGHGTHVAGTIAQATNNGIGVTGVAPEATILPLKVLAKTGGGQSDWIAAAIDEAVDSGAKVINLSLGGGHSEVLVNAVEKAREAGVVVVAAAGNAGREGLGSPADAPSAIGVSAVGPDSKLAPYSSWGKGVEIAAPGGNKLVTAGGILQQTIDGTGKPLFAEFQGTSMATPHVAGAAAVLWGAGAGSAEEVERMLKLGATPMGDENRFGAGLLNVEGSVKRLLLERQGVLAAVGGAVGVGLSLLGSLTGLARVVTVLTAGVTAGGIFGLLLLPLAPSRWLSLFSEPFMAWPGPYWSGFPLWQSCLIPLLVGVLLAPSKSFGPVAIGFMAGCASWLLYGAASHQSGIWWMPLGLDTSWLVANGMIVLLAALAASGMQKLMRKEQQ